MSMVYVFSILAALFRLFLAVLMICWVVGLCAIFRIDRLDASGGGMRGVGLYDEETGY
jgi:hypothetical protein